MHRACTLLSAGTHLHLHDLNRAVSAGQNEREAREEAEQKMKQQADLFAMQQDRALKAVGQGHEAAAHPEARLWEPNDENVVLGGSTAVKWVEVQNEAGPLRVNDKARDILMGINDIDPLNILMVVGAARCGKSFLMNALTGFDDVFPVSAAVAPCTAGADLSPNLMPLSKFASGGGRNSALSSSAPPQPTIAFVDMEGQGDKSAEHHVRLAVPFLLVSKVSDDPI